MQYQVNTPILQMGKLRSGGWLREADLRSGKISGVLELDIHKNLCSGRASPSLPSLPSKVQSPTQGRHSIRICWGKKSGTLLPSYVTWIKSSNLSEALCPHL